MMKKIKDLISNFINGFCMALADSVPGVSGGTIAFILGFYDNFISSLDDLFRGSLKKKKTSLIFLIKIGIGWVCGFLLSAVILSSLFESHIYIMSSLFMGFVMAAIPLVIKEEKGYLRGRYYNLIYTLIGICLVVTISLLNYYGGFHIDITQFSIINFIYIFITASIAITAMVLPGISGSTLLLIFGLYIPIMGAVKEVLSMNFSLLPILIVFALGIICGIVFFVKLIRKGLDYYRSQTIYMIIGMMIGSLFSICMGPTTLDVPLDMLSFKTFNIIFFIIGIVIIILLELLKNILNKE